MIAIEKKSYKSLEPILNLTPKTTPTNARGVLDGYITGTVYSDVSTNINSILVSSGDGTYFVCGEPTDQFLDKLLAFYENRSSERFTIFSPTKCWDKTIEQTFNGHHYKMKRTILAYKPSHIYEDTDRDHIANDFKVRPITEELIRKSIYFNEAYYIKFWGSVEQFLKYGFGFCVVNKTGEIVSECVSIFRSRNQINIDIQTSKGERGKGLAKLTAQTLINKCLDNKLIPLWDCDHENSGSLKLAKKLGFEEISQYNLFHK